MAGPDDVLVFWRAAGPEKWFKKDPAFDSEITQRFLTDWRAAAAGRMSAWEETPDGALALVIVGAALRSPERADGGHVATAPEDELTKRRRARRIS